MSYYRRNHYRRSSGGGSRWMPLRYSGTCKVCEQTIPGGTYAYWDASARTVTCDRIECAEADGLTRQEWHGSPVSGGYVSVLAESRIGAGAETPAFYHTRSRGYYGRDAGRCEDAPCCGCCS